MALRDLIKSQVANAFVSLDDIKQPIDFDISNGRSYDFSNGAVTETSFTVSLEGVIEDISTNEGKASSNILEGVSARFIINREDLPDVYNKFDTFTTNGVTYKIIEFKDNGYSVEGTGVAG